MVKGCVCGWCDEGPPLCYMTVCRQCGGRKTSEEMGEGGICKKCWDDALYPEFSRKEFKET